jgi:BirA family transcriptional regulator, biotin operon repressor / biotin---[acetyl-CoA-carboxylase] ligase
MVLWFAPRVAADINYRLVERQTLELSLPLPHNLHISSKVPTRRNPALAPAHLTDARLGRIIRLLMDHATMVVSGTKVAAELKITRSEVWRLIQQLRSLGVEVEGHPATGYQLRAMPDLLLPEILSPLLHGTIFGTHLHHAYKIPSTSTAAMEAAFAGAPEGSVFLSEEQTAGRGRGANVWHSARSTGIYCSVILRPALPPANVLVLSLAAALAVRGAIQDINPGLIPDLKWPNDLLVDGKKFCGILTEMNAEPTRVRHIVVGIGINVNQVSFPEELRPIATSLLVASGSEWSRVDLTATLLKSLDREYRALLNDAHVRESILRRFSSASSYVRGKRVRIEENGDAAFEGMTEGLDERGFLKVRTVEGLRTVLSGTVRAL